MRIRCGLVMLAADYRMGLQCSALFMLLEDEARDPVERILPTIGTCACRLAL
jgi:hypothetical protein